MKKLKKKNNWNLWDYLYYRVTKFYLKKEKNYGFEDNKRRGSYTVGLLLSLNIESLIFLFLTFFTEKNPFLIDYGGLGFMGLFLLIIFYTVYIYEKKRHSQIFDKYKNEDTEDKKIREMFLIAYVLFTAVLLFVSVYLGRNFWN